MSTTQPIRNKHLLKQFKNYYMEQEFHPRNYTLILVGLNTALRINDILHLTWDMVYEKGKVKRHIVVTEQKTGKENRIFLNNEVRGVLQEYKEKAGNNSYHNPYLFSGMPDSHVPLSRYQAYRIIRKAAQNIGMEDFISCHSLRKTFGYHAWKQGTPPALLMSIFNHSSYQITRRYLCIDQDDKDEVFSKIRL